MEKGFPNPFAEDWGNGWPCERACSDRGQVLHHNIFLLSFRFFTLILSFVKFPTCLTYMNMTNTPLSRRAFSKHGLQYGCLIPYPRWG